MERLRAATSYLLHSDKYGAHEARVIWGGEGIMTLVDARSLIADHYGTRVAIHRLVLSPQATPALARVDTLAAWTRGLLGAVGRRTGRSLVWMAAAHGDTGTPHVHVVLAGADAGGVDLSISVPLLRWMEATGADLAETAERRWSARADRLLTIGGGER